LAVAKATVAGSSVRPVFVTVKAKALVPALPSFCETSLIEIAGWSRHQRGGRGEPLVDRDAEVRAAIAASRGLVDTDAVTAAWEAALAARVWEGPLVWVHGDLLPGNVLVERGRLSAVIDFGGLSVGDPACELMAGWTLFSGVSREVFREALSVDEATWARARGWAVSVAVIALPYYQETNPVFAANARHWIAEVLADHASGL
jgi:aminoglycoside phosphotransferase (APT) family kinase protein